MKHTAQQTMQIRIAAATPWMQTAKRLLQGKLQRNWTISLRRTWQPVPADHPGRSLALRLRVPPSRGHCTHEAHPAAVARVKGHLALRTDLAPLPRGCSRAALQLGEDCDWRVTKCLLNKETMTDRHHVALSVCECRWYYLRGTITNTGTKIGDFR